MARQKGSASFSGTLEILAGGPVDARTIVPTKADLTVSENFPYKYVGMVVSVQSECIAYMLTDLDTTDITHWKAIGSDTGQTIQVDTLPTATSELEGTIYQYVGATTAALTNGFFYKCVESTETAGTYLWTAIPTTDAIPSSKKGAANGVAELDANGLVPASQLPSYVDDVIEGYYDSTLGKFYEESTHTTEIDGEAGKIYIDLTDAPSVSTYRWSGSAFYKIVDEDLKIQFTTMPTAGDYVGKVIQYIGTTTASYTSGYFYESVEDLENPGTYIWQAVNVQDSGSEAVVLTGTMTAANWSNNEQSVTVTGLATTDNGTIGLLDTATSAQIEAAASAEIRVSGISANTVTFTCGTTPEIDIPFGILLYKNV